MRLYQEILSGEESAKARCVWLLGGGAYFIGVKSVGDFSPEKIVLYFPRYCVEVAGENLQIEKYCEGDLSLQGKINAVTLSTEKGV